MDMPERNATARYQQMTGEELFLQFTLLESIFRDFLRISGYPDDLKYNVDVIALAEILTRVDKRAAYYSFFHDGNKIHEMKRVGIFIYWLLKFKPFAIIDPRCLNSSKALKKNFELHESLAVSLVYSGLMKSEKLKTAPPKDSPIHKTLLYAFKYRELSQDSIMTLVYSLCNI